MMDIYQICEMVQKALRSERIFCDVYPSFGEDKVNVEISWGDWKHEHLRANMIVARMGGKLICEWETEENGTDCYSGVHQFVFS